VDTRRILLSVILATLFAAGRWLLLRRRSPDRTMPADPRWIPLRPADVSAGALGFLAVLFLLKILPLLGRPLGLLRRDFLFPLWALWRTDDGAWWLLPPVMLFAAVLVAARRGLLRRLPTSVFLVGSMALAVALWTSLSLTNGGFPEGLVWPFQRDADYYVDVARFPSLASIWTEYLDRQPELSLHGRTHPPGGLTVLFLLDRLAGSRLTLVCLGAVLLGAVTLLPLKFWARHHLSEEESRAACLLWIFTPAVTLYGATCMDMVFAVPVVTSGALFIRGLATETFPARAEGSRQALGWGFLSGLALAAGTLFTFSALLLAPVFCVLVASRLRRDTRLDWRPVVLLAAAGATCATALLLLRPLAGFDWLACLRVAAAIDVEQAPAFLSLRYYLLTRLMGALDFLVLAGVATSPIWLRLLAPGPARRTGGPAPPDHDSLLLTSARAAAVVAAGFLLAGVYKIGETGRIWMFLLPFVLLPVCRALSRSVSGRSRDGVASARETILPSGTAALLCWGFAQSLLMEFFLDTRW
jgi:hypothetical protein